MALVGKGEADALTFDPEALMPASVQRQRVEVLDDRGSTVLVRIQR